MDKTLVSLKEVAQLLGVSAATANYYTNMGLFRISKRKGNCRLYDKDQTLKRFERIKSLRSQGYSLGLIQQQFLNSPPDDAIVAG
jgi:DNA-binding transcriptional MerR regulator